MASFPFHLTVKHSRRARRVRIAVYRDMRVVVTAPLRMRLAQVETYIQSKLPWIGKVLSRYAALPKAVFFPSGVRSYHRYRERARKLAHARARHFARQIGVSYARIAIKDHKSKWGSCSKKGFLNFNYRIIFLPPQLADYIIVHELCHLEHMNHSRFFWQRVKQHHPSYLAARRTLKQYLW